MKNNFKVQKALIEIHESLSKLNHIISKYSNEKKYKVNSGFSPNYRKIRFNSLQKAICLADNKESLNNKYLNRQNKFISSSKERQNSVYYNLTEYHSSKNIFGNNLFSGELLRGIIKKEIKKCYLGDNFIYKSNSENKEINNTIGKNERLTYISTSPKNCFQTKSVNNSYKNDKCFSIRTNNQKKIINIDPKNLFNLGKYLNRELKESNDINIYLLNGIYNINKKYKGLSEKKNLLKHHISLINDENKILDTKKKELDKTLTLINEKYYYKNKYKYNRDKNIETKKGLRKNPKLDLLEKNNIRLTKKNISLNYEIRTLFNNLCDLCKK